MRIWSLCALLLLLSGLAAICATDGVPDIGDKFEGTQKADLAKLQLPRPSDVTIAVLPFWDYKSNQRHVDLMTDSVRDELDRHGFKLLSKDAAANAVKADGEIEPGQPFRRADALRMGKALKANWVVYGEIYELETYTKNSIFSSKKKAKLSHKISVLDVATGEVLYWHKRSDTSGGHGGPVKRATSTERHAVDISVGRAMYLLTSALPEHPVKSEEAADQSTLNNTK